MGSSVTRKIERQRLGTNPALWSEFHARKPVGLSIRDGQTFRDGTWDLPQQKRLNVSIYAKMPHYGGSFKQNQWACPLETGKLSVTEDGIFRNRNA